MKEEIKAVIMDKPAMNRAVMRITHEILERNNGLDGIVLVGIRRRGFPLAEQISANMQKIEGNRPALGALDITMYRDDLTKLYEQPVTQKTDIPFDVTGKKIVLVDDVIYTGRTVRAAIEAIFALGRPAQIQLAVLIDRGHRELPLRPDFVGKNVPTSHSEKVNVNIFGIDGEDSVTLSEMHE